MGIEKLEFCSKIENIVDEQFFAILMKTNSSIFDAYKNVLNFPQTPPELQIPTDSEGVQLRNILALMFGRNLLDVVTTKRREANLHAKNGGDENDTNNKERDELTETFELIRCQLNAFFEQRQKHFKGYNFSKTVQSTAKTLRQKGFNLIAFKHIVIEFGGEEKELIGSFISNAKSLLNELK